MCDAFDSNTSLRAQAKINIYIKRRVHLAKNIPMKSITAEEMTRWARSTGGEAAE